MTLFPIRFLCFIKNTSSKSNFIDFSCKNEGLTRKKDNNLISPLPSQKSMKLDLLEIILNKTKESDKKKPREPEISIVKIYDYSG